MCEKKTVTFCTIIRIMITEMSEQKYPHLDSAPIIEAILEHRVEPSASLSKDDLEAWGDGMDEFPHKEVVGHLDVKFELSNDNSDLKSLEGAPGFEGWRFISADRQKYVQVQSNRFIFNQSSQYSTGEAFRSAFSPLWKRYLEIAKPNKIQRVGLRCINRIDLPIEKLNFEDYFNFFVMIPEKMPQAISELFLRSVIQDPESVDTKAIVSIGMNPAMIAHESKTFSVFFDIDTIKICDYNPGLISLNEVHEYLGQYRNRIFYNGLTPKALKLYGVEQWPL